MLLLVKILSLHPSVQTCIYFNQPIFWQFVDLHWPSSMTSPEIIDILQQVFGGSSQESGLLQHNTDVFSPSFCTAVSLNVNRYKHILLLSKIVFRFGENFRFSLQKLPDVKISLPENIVTNITRAYLHWEGKKLFVCVGEPNDTSPKAQQSTNRQLHAIWQEHQLRMINK